MNDAVARQRIDKWLWFARVVKSRTLAQKLVTGGRVRVNREKEAQASHFVKLGDVLTITLERRILILKIVDLGERRGPAPEAQSLYEDLSPPPAAQIPRAGPRPTKRDRRVMDGFHSAFDGGGDDSFAGDERD